MGSRGFFLDLTHFPVTAHMWLCNTFMSLCCLSGVSLPAWAVLQLQHSCVETRCQPCLCFKVSQVWLCPWSIRGLCQGTVIAGGAATPKGAVFASCWKSPACVPFLCTSFHFSHHWLWCQDNAAGPSCSAVSLCRHSWTIASWCWYPPQAVSFTTGKAGFMMKPN